LLSGQRQSLARLARNFRSRAGDNRRDWFISRTESALNDHLGSAKMRTIAVILTIGVLTMLAACVLTPPPINSLAFQKRPPLPGQPGYLQTINYIDDGLHYITPNAGFFISAAGDMCFEGASTPGVTPVYIPPNYWCMSPFAVSRVEAIENNISYINQVRLWCRLAAPQCAYKVGYPNVPDNLWIANSITAETVPFLRQRDAVEYLIYLMGGNVRRDQAAQ
jgi:hypothetical protein